VLTDRPPALIYLLKLRTTKSPMLQI